jgi:hypothetical protein
MTIEDLSGLTIDQVIDWLLKNQEKLLGKRAKLQTANNPEIQTDLGQISLEKKTILCFLDWNNKDLWAMEASNLVVRLNIEEQYVVFSIKKDLTGSNDKFTIFL